MRVMQLYLVNSYIKFQLGMHFDDVRSQSSTIHVFPFNSDKKRGGVAIQMVIIYWHFNYDAYIFCFCSKLICYLVANIPYADVYMLFCIQTTPQTDSEIHIHWKGAAEIVLGCCRGYIDVNDQLVEMDEEKV